MDSLAHFASLFRQSATQSEPMTNRSGGSQECPPRVAMIRHYSRFDRSETCQVICAQAPFKKYFVRSLHTVVVPRRGATQTPVITRLYFTSLSHGAFTQVSVVMVLVYRDYHFARVNQMRLILAGMP